MHRFPVFNTTDHRSLSTTAWNACRQLSVEAERCISFIEARKIVTLENKAQPPSRGQSMAIVVRSSGGQQRPTTRSMYTQTDLTWPEDQEAPATISSTACSESSKTEASGRTSPHACANSGDHTEGRGPSRPPRRNQTSPKQQTASNTRKRQPSSQDASGGQA